MSARPLKLLLAIEDRQTLQHCARLLTAFGYKVSCAASLALAIGRLRADRPDVLVAGGSASQESALALFHAAASEGPPHQIFKLLLLRDQSHTELLKALEAGADDFLAMPLDSAELLARLRAAARVLEFERRLGELAPREEVTGLLNRHSFLLRLQGELRTAQRSRTPVACIALQPDAYAELRDLHGLPAAQRAMQELATRINEGHPRTCCGRIDALRFALAVPATAEEALARAQQLRTAVAKAGVRVGDVEAPWTISLGLAVGDGDAATAPQLLEHAEKALAVAQQSGGDEVVTYDVALQEERSWTELAGGRLFEGAVLRNFMAPCPRLLRTTDSLEQADAVLEQSRLTALPVVDEEGKLVGLLSADRPRMRLAGDRESEAQVADAMNAEPISFDEATTLPVLLDYFAREAPPVVVVVHKARPTGVVTPESLATLVEPLSTASFAPPRPAAGRAGLVVPHLCIAQ